MNERAAAIRFGSSWSTQFRLTQAIGRALSELTDQGSASEALAARLVVSLTLRIP